ITGDPATRAAQTCQGSQAPQQHLQPGELKWLTPGSRNCSTSSAGICALPTSSAISRTPRPWTATLLPPRSKLTSTASAAEQPLALVSALGVSPATTALANPASPC